MIRFLNLKGQIVPGDDTDTSFAYYDTISDTIMTFSGEDVFSSLARFKWAHSLEYGEETKGRDLNRFINLIPKQFFNPSFGPTQQN